MAFRIGDLEEEEDNQENENPKRLIRRLTTIEDTESNNYYQGTKRVLHGMKLFCNNISRNTRILNDYLVMQMV